MNNFLILFTEIIGESWFWQGIIINTSFTLATLPFTNKMVQKIFKNRKRNKIKNARKELEIYCLQQLLKDKHLNKEDFENQIYMIANRYKLDIKDIYNDKNTFFKNLTHTILEIDLLDDGEKERLSNRIRKEKVFTESDYKTLDHNSTLSDERERIFEDKEEYIELDRNEKKTFSNILVS